MVFVIIFGLAELFERISIFEFFAIFVRQLYQISIEMLPIGAILGIIVIVWALLFWILDQNSSDPAYADITGFGNALIDSYRLALGDFEVADNFGEDKNFIFWTVFFIGTLISLLIILNMVIAVMGAAFTKIEENQQSYIYRSKIKLIIENHHRLNDSIKD